MEAHKIDIEKLICEVENQPPLWDIRKKEYSDRVMRRKCWEELVNLFAKENNTIDENKQLGNELHKKWKNIRDNFSRDIHQRKGKSGAGAYRKAPYVYTQRLQFQFLTNVILPRQTTSSLDNEYSSELDTNNPETPTLIYKEKYNSKIDKKGHTRSKKKYYIHLKITKKEQTRR
ncbi:unnamed protein product [Acanthoscelides obtectus]|uniref:MADF domain-containing protein n=1 Tax=Acanthoscelides obtectus TaxID=200917 RepID=A0A9P0PS73_ACAOB|nr:unnamed protein product [Acanthoscelides obtectus]CAK1686113.1 hypothetical protein AOBTE_LOCUS35789 [Acanthoscelides obtectus]